MKKHLYISITFFFILLQMLGQDNLKSITPFYLFYQSSGALRGITKTIEIKNNGIIKYKLKGVSKDEIFTKTIKMDKKSFQVIKSQLVNYYKILELPRENLSCKTCLDGEWVELKFKILSANRDIAANNPSSANKIFKELEEYLFEVIGKLDS